MHIRCLLGIVSCEDPSVSVDISKAKGNSTRWILDILQPWQKEEISYELKLLDFRHPKKVKEIETPTPHFTPLSLSAQQAAILADPDRLKIRIIPNRDSEERGDIHFRVAVDVYHSLHR